MRISLPAFCLAAVCWTTNAYSADTLAEQWSFGLSHQYYAIALPSQAKERGLPLGGEDGDVYGTPAAIALSLGKHYSDHMSFIAEVAFGYSTSKESIETISISFNDEISQDSEEFETSLDYSASVLTQFRPLGKTAFRPFLTVGLNTTSISYDYVIEGDQIETPIKGSETVSSTGLIYGLGFEFYLWDKLELQYDFQVLPHMEEQTELSSLGLSYSF